MSRMPPYLKFGKDGHYRAQRVVPRRLQGLVGVPLWQKHIGKATRATAARVALDFAVEKGRLIESLNALTDSERAKIVAAGGLDKWINRSVSEKQHILADLPFIEHEAARLPYAATDLDKQLATEAQGTLARLDVIERTARKLLGDHTGTLTGLVDLWKKVRAPRNPATEGSARRALKHFIAICGDLDPRDVTADHARAFRDRLDKDGHSVATITKWLYRMHAVFAVGVAEGKVTTNPYYKIKAFGRTNGKASDRRMPFSRDQIKLILSRCHELKPDDCMVAKLMINHGARPSELCQLRCVDVLEVDGVPALRITDEGEDGTLKNTESFRTIPIHPACVQEVLALVTARRAAGKAMLFDYSFVPSKGTRSHRFSEKFNNWLRGKLKITDKRLVAYSARHSFKDACRAATMPEYIANQIMGHRLAKGHAGGYGIGVSVPELAKWLERIAY